MDWTGWIMMWFTPSFSSHFITVMTRRRVWREQLVCVCQTGSEGLMLLYRYRTVWGVYRLLVSTRSITRCMLLYFPRSLSRHHRRALRRLCTHLLQHGCAKIRRESNNQKSRSSAAHMGNVQAWEWVSCVHLFTFTASVLLFTPCSITLPLLHTWTFVLLL